MGKRFDAITSRQEAFIKEQHVFFVASAPLDGAGHVNLSPKGFDCFRIFGPDRVAYLDMTGSGNETSAHLTENGRITFMFCAFEGAPKILRLYGNGRVILPGSALWEERIGHFPELPGRRQIIEADIYQTQESCGFGVPLMTYESDRSTLTKWSEKMGPEKLAAYREEKNSRSLDGLPAGP